jgi:DNA-binding MarR family transcriptional regulator
MVAVVASVIGNSRGYWLLKLSLNTQELSALADVVKLSTISDYTGAVEQIQTRWLTAEEQRTWRTFISACRRLFAEMDGHLQHVTGIPHAYYEILVRLSEAPGRELRMTQLADASISSKSRLSHAVARLEERGWVERTACPTDRRGQVARLTDEGFAALAAAAPGHVEQVRRMVFDLLTPEQVEQLGVISATIEAGVEEVASSEAASACHAAEADEQEPDEQEPDDGSCPLG